MRPFQVLKNRFVVFILLLLLSLSCMAQSNVYSLWVYAGGVSSRELCSFAFPFSPHNYRLTESRWTEDANGLTVSFVGHTRTPGDIPRRALAVASGTNAFSLAIDFNSSQKLKKTYGVVGLKETGNLARTALQCITHRGGRTGTNALPVAQNGWIRLSRENLDLIALDGDHFEEIGRILERACGAPDTTIYSSHPIGNGRSLTYTPQQIGVVVVVNLDADSTITILSVIGKRTM